MTLRVLYQAQNKLTHLFGLIFLCSAYFYGFLSSELVNIFFQLSCFIGRILVNKFLILCKFALEAVRLISSFLQVLYEDSLVFINDAAEKLTCIIYLFKYIYLSLEELGSTVVGKLCLLVKAIGSITEVFRYTVASLRHGIHFTGSTIWKFLTSIPGTVILQIDAINNFIINSCKDLVSLVCMFTNKIFECLEKIYLFFFDIPLDSVYGLIIGAVLASIIYIKFHDICTVISNAAVKFFKQMIILGNNLKTGRFLDKRKEENFEYDEDNERLCVVCQYHLKEIIIFPCKHLCLCTDCSLQLVKILPKCPICRCEIRKTLKVYL